MKPLFPLLLGVMFLQGATAQDIPQFEFKDGGQRTFMVEHAAAARIETGPTPHWLTLRSLEHPDQKFESSDRIAIELRKGAALKAVLAGAELKVAQQVNETTFVLQASNPLEAAAQAAKLAKHPEVVNCAPVMRSLNLQLQTPIAPLPNDPHYFALWHLENITNSGIDLNVRGAWPLTRGSGINIAIADQAIELSHPDLASRTFPGAHFNFINNSTDLQLTDKDTHGTGVAGLAVAQMNNSKGVIGVAPEANFASWRIFSTNGAITDDQQLMNMFQYRADSVAVQNHSWASTSRSLYSIGFLARMGIEQAITQGRDGKGVVMVRSAGNRRLGGYEGGIYREQSGNANDDGFCTNPDVIVVGAARFDGRVARYSSPGANVLVAGLSNEALGEDTTVADPVFPALRTTGLNGAYTSFSGTSGAVPQIAGIASLILAANTNFTYRDVQQILLLSARHFDLGDPDLRTNGAGLRVSHNLGFGIPDAERAVYLAKNWINRPQREQLTFSREEQKTIPDQGFVVRASGLNVPNELYSIPALMPKESRHPDIAPGEKQRPDSPTEPLPVRYVGQATSEIAEDLSGKIALIQRGGGVSFSEKVKRAQDAGATGAIVFDNQEGSLVLMSITNFTTIPCTFIGKAAGEALVAQSETNTEARAQLALNAATYTFQVTNTLSLEHVGARIRTDNLRRADIRITLTSPSGTRSILQRANNDPSTNAPIDWTYISNQHFYESSVGTWTLQISDEAAGAESFAYLAELHLYGVSIPDSDGDGLSDEWEDARFGSLAESPSSDSDGDGFSNIQESLLQTDPVVHNKPVITEQPQHRVATAGATVRFDVHATGMQPLFYQWRFKGTNIAGATKSSLSLANVKNTQAGVYSVEVGNYAGTVLSSDASLGFFKCAFQTATSDTNLLFTGGSGTISINTSNGCQWGASTKAGWISFTTPTNGFGPGSVSFIATSNLGLPRRATVTVAGNPITIMQAGAFLPETIGGRSFVFRFDTNGPFANAVRLVISADGSTARLFEQGSTNVVQSGVCTWVRESDGAGRIIFEPNEFLIRFDSGNRGAFLLNSLVYHTLSGTFALSSSQPDFNQDGLVDLLFQGTNQVLHSWSLNGTTFIRNTALRSGTPASAGWRAVGATDFNGDGSTDIFFANGSQHAVWLMNGTALTRSRAIGTPLLPPQWRSVALGDVNDDGKEELLAQNGATGRLSVWHISNYRVERAEWPVKIPPLAWRIFGFADFNGDRKPDLVMQHTTTRKLTAWHFDGITYTGSKSLASGKVPATVWRAVGTADLNGDGANDILFQNGAGYVYAWLMDGPTFLSSTPIRKGVLPPRGGKLRAPN